MLTKRIVTALVLLPFVIWLLFRADAREFTVTLSLVFTLAAWEWSQLMGLKLPSHRFSYVIFFQSIMLLIIWLVPNLEFWPGDAKGHVFDHGIGIPNLPIVIIMIGAIWWLINLFCLIFGVQDWLRGDKLMLPRALAGVLIMIPSWAALISLHTESLRISNEGNWLLLFVLLQIWAADTGAFFSGKQFGKTPLAPKVSPKKTWEGVIGGSLLALIIAYFTAESFGLQSISLLQLFLISVTIIVFSIVGDLTESIYKRQQNIKDSSNILPGHGGILDRIDSITSAVPVFALIYFWLL
jgi:phosphatidate cytidylyltransferase